MYTIEDLKNGKCVVINDGTIKELLKVFKLAVPNSRKGYNATCRYYWANEGYYWCNGDLNIKKLPEQSVKQFLKQIEYTIIKEGDQFYHSGNKNQIYKISKIQNNSVTVACSNSICNYQLKDCLEFIKKGYWILIKNQNNMEKKIAAYKLIKPEYAKAVKSICNLTKSTDVSIINMQTSIDSLKNADVLHLWFEPICQELEYQVGDYITCLKNGWNNSEHPNYKHKGAFEVNKNRTQKIVKIDLFRNNFVAVGHLGGVARIETCKNAFRKATEEEIEIANSIKIEMFSSNKGNFEIEIIDGKAFYRPDKKWLPKEFIEEIIDWFDDSSESFKYNSNLIYTLKVELLTVGCMQGTRLEDWKNVLKHLN